MNPQDQKETKDLDKKRFPLSKILSLASLAPSVENIQPWKIEKVEDSLQVYLDEKHANPGFDRDLRMAKLSIGAFLENFSVSSSHFGWDAKISVHESSDKIFQSPVASLRWESSKASGHPLFESIQNRWTNRFPYEIRRPLRSSILESLQQTVESESSLKCRFLTFSKEIHQAAKILKIFDIVRFSIPEENHNLLSALRSKKEERIKKDGLGFASLGLGRMDQGFLAVIRTLRLSFLLSRGPMPRVMAKTTRNTIPQSSTLMMISVSKNVKPDFLMWGSLIERAWLRATFFALSTQPLYAPVHYSFLAGRHRNCFDSVKLNRILEASKALAHLFHLDEGEEFVMLFRLGYSKRERIASPRRPLEIQGVEIPLSGELV